MRKIKILIFLIIISKILVAQTDLTNGLVAYYPFNGNANDESGNEYNGSVYGAILTSDKNEKINSAYYFDGINDYLSISNNSDLNSEVFSISFWFYQKSKKSENNFLIDKASVYKKNGWSLYIYDKDKIEFYGSIMSTTKLNFSNNEWHHLVVNYENGYVEFFLDDKDRYTSFVGNIINNSTSVYIGCAHNNKTSYFNGKIDEVRFYNRILSKEEVSELYNEIEITKIDLSLPKLTITYPDISKVSTITETKKQITLIGTATDNSGILEILVNDLDATVNTDGSFSKTLNLAIGDNIITVKATDIYNNTTTKTFTIKRTSETENIVIIDDEITEIDIDVDIPEIGKIKTNRFALIIGNENYIVNGGIGADVTFALNDARTFKKYAIATLGIPEENIIYLENGTRTQMRENIELFLELMNINATNREFYIYYAGHGLPDENNDAYLMPVDIKQKYIEDAFKLSDLYADLKEKNPKKVVVFLDACFSGGGRTGDNLIAARSGVRIKPNDESISGNLLVFAAASENQVSKPFTTKQHGMFTYYLLKAIQESKGKITYDELTTEVINNVSTYSLTINKEKQTPVVNVSPDISTTWEMWNLND